MESELAKDDRGGAFLSSAMRSATEV